MFLIVAVLYYNTLDFQSKHDVKIGLTLGSNRVEGEYILGAERM